MLQPLYQILELEPIQLIGKQTRTSLAQNQTPQLWKSLKTEAMKVSPDPEQLQFAVRCYEANPTFIPTEEYTAWAAFSYSDGHAALPGMQEFEIPGGLYAKFLHSGSQEQFIELMRHIFMEWMPDSEYSLDDRPHFERFNFDYKPGDTNSNEELFIPIQRVQVYG